MDADKWRIASSNARERREKNCQTDADTLRIACEAVTKSESGNIGNCTETGKEIRRIAREALAKSESGNIGNCTESRKEIRRIAPRANRKRIAEI